MRQLDASSRNGARRRGGLLTAGIVPLLLAGRSEAIDLVPGFTATTVATGISRGSALVCAPDGRLFACEQDGNLRLVKDGVLLASPALSLSVNSLGERGLLGVAFDPDFASNHFLYVYYTAASPTIHNRVSRFTMSGDTVVAGSETVLMDLETLSATNHNAGALRFGADGMLYIATGDNAVAANSQTLSNRLGKILRIHPDGAIPTDNPFFAAASGANRAIWARGLRNPYTFDIQSGTGRIYINDVGLTSWEEINDGVAGANYGWPNFEGAGGAPAYADPVYAYRHGGGAFEGFAIAGAAFYNPSSLLFPAAYHGDYFFADYINGWIHVLDPATQVVAGFATGGGNITDLEVGADGALYSLARNTGTIVRITANAPEPGALALLLPVAALAGGARARRSRHHGR